MGSFANPSTATRRDNRGQVLSLIARAGTITRRELCKATGLTGAGVSRVTRELIDLGLIIEKSPKIEKGTAGRRTTPLAINPEGAFVFGIGVTGNKRTVSLVNAIGDIIAERKFDHVPLGDPSAICSSLSQLIRELAATGAADQNRILGAGISVPAGAVIEEAGIVTSRVLGWSGVPLADMLGEQCPYPIKVMSRASSLIHAVTQRDSDAEAGDFYLINVSVGVGSAWARFDGTMHQEWPLGSIAHLRHPDVKRRCLCGGHGCMEVAGSGIAVVGELFGELGEPYDYAVLGRRLQEARFAVDHGDKAAKAAYRMAGRRMAFAIQMMDALIAPARIILAGETGRQQDYKEGVVEGLRSQNLISVEKKLHTNCATTAEAAASTALERFVFTNSIDVEKLRAA